MIYRKKIAKREVNIQKEILQKYYVPFITVFKERFIYNLAKKKTLLLTFSNSSLIKAFRVSSAASSKFSLIDMACRISVIPGAKILHERCR